MKALEGGKTFEDQEAYDEFRNAQDVVDAKELIAAQGADTPLMAKIEKFEALENIDAILEHGGAPSHHHGIGKMMAPWMEAHLGSEQMAVLRALKTHCDPNGILNPGGQLGLDLPEAERRAVPQTGATPDE